MNLPKPNKKGDYVIVRGVLYSVSGKRNETIAAAALGRGKIANIGRWNGREWMDTGMVLHGT